MGSVLVGRPPRSSVFRTTPRVIAADEGRSGAFERTLSDYQGTVVATPPQDLKYGGEKKIETGSKNKEWTEVISGLAEGDVIVKPND